MSNVNSESAPRHRRLWIAAAAGALAVAALVWAFAPRPLPVELATATPGRFEASIDEDGRTRLVQRYVVSAPLAGQLARITLREGDVVEAGAVLATITPSPVPLLDARSAREAAAREAAARAQLERAGVRIERARVGVEQARTELRRSEQLARDGFIAPTKLDADGLAFRAAQRELDTAVQDRNVAAHDLEQARAALSALPTPPSAATASPRRPGTASFAVRAPVAGTVLRIVQPSEASVVPGTALVELGDLARLEVVAELLTTDALRTPAGTPVRIERWGGDGVLQGRVERVEPAAFTKVSALGVEEQRVKVVIAITSPREQWRTLGEAYRVGVRLLVVQTEQALQVPSSAVFPLAGDDAGPSALSAPSARRMAAFVVEGGRARLVPVLLRARNGHMAWIAEGLAAGSRVIVYPSAQVQDGARVVERRP